MPGRAGASRTDQSAGAQGRMASATMPTSTVVQRESTGRKQIGQCRFRLIFLGFGITVFYAMLAMRLVDISVIQPWVMKEEASLAQTTSVTTISRFRNNIVDRNGVLLASSISSRSLFANPQIVKRFGVDLAVSELVRVFPRLNAASLRDSLNSERTFVYIKRNLTPNEQAAVNAMGIPGLEFEDSEKRVYPHGNLFSHILGFVGVDNKGLSGVEQYFNDSLSKEGNALELSVDSRVQNILREELQAGVEEFKAIGAVGAVMDIKTGEILAMVSLPDFDPNNPNSSSAEAKFNRATAGVYEMGSTFKTFTMAMGLEYGTTTIQGGYDARHPIRYAGHTISDSHPENRWLSVPEIFMHSSNIGTVKMVMDVGRKRQREFLGKLGMLEPVTLELPEAARPLVPNPWRDINMMTVSFGHGISVTPLHLIRAVASLAGEGKLLTPTFVKGGNILKDKAEPIVSEEVVGHMRKLLRLVVEHGTGKKANAEGYRVGGKTGTAEKTKSGRYAAHDKLASFVGVFPAEKPRFAILAMLDEPRGNKSTYGFATGGWVAAPVVRKIVERVAPIYGIKPVYEMPQDGTKVQQVSPRMPQFQPQIQNNPRLVHAVSF